MGGATPAEAKATMKASAMRTRAGTVRWPSTGITWNRASTRTKGHSTGVSQPSSWASVRVNTAGRTWA